MGAVTLPPSLATTDVLGAVHTFITQFAQIPGVPELKPSNILRGWEALSTIPAVAELCIITLLQTIRHGFDASFFVPNSDPAALSELSLEKLSEYVVQVDFVGLAHAIAPDVTLRRATQVEMVANSIYSPGIFSRIAPGLSCLYCEGVQSLGEIGGDSSIKHRHMLTLHLSGVQQTRLPVSTFDGVSLHIEDAIEHHKHD